MKCPEVIRNLYMKEYEKNRSNPQFAIVIPRRGTYTPPEFKLAEEETSEKLLRAWYAFHEKANHKTYKDLHSKSIYCRELKVGAISSDAFLELIADRSFLFLEYNENYNNALYPPLSEAIKDCEIYQESESDRENMRKVLEQAFVPTYSHAGKYDEWNENLMELKTAKAQRERQRACLSAEVESFTISVSKFDGALTAEEVYLGKLFHAYVNALSKQAYEHFVIFDDGTKHKPWESAIHHVFQHLSSQPSSDPIYRSLVFFHLFTKKAKQLTAGTMKRYSFGAIEKRKTALEDPMYNQPRIDRRIRCNIMLFDYLLEFFMPENLDADAQEIYRADAKYVFYCYSRYDRYWHYSISDRRDTNGYLQISFALSENYKDGVDHFGNLLRHHIHFCLPSHAQWLIPVLSHDKVEPPLAVLTTMLLAEGVQQIPARSRMTNRVQALLNSNEGEKMLCEYERDFMDFSKTKEHLEEWCKQLPNMPWESEFVYESGAHKKEIQSCRRLILEYSLKERMIQLAREQLNKIAVHLFNDLCLGEYSYTTHPYVEI